MSTTLAKPVPRPWRRVLRFSVRAMIGVVLVVGCLLGWIVRSAHIQREAVAAIEAVGGNVEYDWDDRTPFTLESQPPPVPRWLVDFLGVHYFGHISGVTLSPNATDTVFAQIGQLTKLKRLTAMRSSVSDAGLTHLDGLTELLSLDLGRTRVSDAGLVHLKALRRLSKLDLGDTQVTDTGLTHLARLGNLSVLNLAGTKVTDTGLVHLKGLNSLSELDLASTLVTDAGLSHLSGLSNLAELDLSYTKVTEKGLVHLTGLKELWRLAAFGTPITDARINELRLAPPKRCVHGIPRRDRGHAE